MSFLMPSCLLKLTIIMLNPEKYKCASCAIPDQIDPTGAVSFKNLLCLPVSLSFPKLTPRLIQIFSVEFISKT